MKKPLSSEGRKVLKSLGISEIDYRLKEWKIADSIIKDMDKRIISAA